MKKTVALFKLSPMAWAPDELVRCINKYSDNFEAYLISPNEKTFSNSDKSSVPVIESDDLSDFDVIHFHNKFIKTDKPSLIQYHSPPLEGIVDFSFPGLKTVIAQYHATLIPYKNCRIVRNIVDIYDPIYNLQEEKKSGIIQNSKVNCLKIGYSPSTRNSGNWYDSKGYNQTINILNKLKYDFNVWIDIIENVPLHECLRRKSECDIVIDECMTSSYHRSGLEGLALGKLTICSLSKEIEDIIKKISGSNIIPFANIFINKLDSYFYFLLNKKQEIKNEGIRNKKWMEDHWNPKVIVKEFESLYCEVLK